MTFQNEIYWLVHFHSFPRREKLLGHPVCFPDRLSPLKTESTFGGSFKSWPHIRFEERSTWLYGQRIIIMLYFATKKSKFYIFFSARTVLSDNGKSAKGELSKNQLKIYHKQTMYLMTKADSQASNQPVYCTHCTVFHFHYIYSSNSYVTGKNLWSKHMNTQPDLRLTVIQRTSF